MEQLRNVSPDAESWTLTLKQRWWAISKPFSLFMNTAVLLFIAVIFFLPFTWMLVSAFRMNPQLNLAFSDFWLGNFIQVFTGDTAIWIRNSLIVATGATVTATTTAFLAAYPFARFNFPGKTLVLFAMLLSMTIPLGVVMLPTFSLARSMGLENSLVGVFLIIAGRQIPLSVWVLKEFIASVPIELEEAAWIDGASKLDTLWRIVFPLTAPGIAVMGMLTFLVGWGDFVVSFLLISSEELIPISMGIYKTSLQATAYGQIRINYGVQTAISLIYMIPPIVLYLLFRQHLIKGMTAGAVKG